MTTLITPLVSEKTFAGAERGVYAFRVSARATKHTVAREVASRFAVTVTAVRISRVPGKSRTRGRVSGYRPGYKKAIVTLRQGDKIKELAS